MKFQKLKNLENNLALPLDLPISYNFESTLFLFFNLPGNGHMGHIIFLYLSIMILCWSFGSIIFWLFTRVYFIFKLRNNKKFSGIPNPTIVEILWTEIPIISLVFLLTSSLELLYTEQISIFHSKVLIITAHQWYWEVDYVFPQDIIRKLKK